MAGRILEAPVLAIHTRARLLTGTHAHTPIYAADGHLADTPAPLQGSSRLPAPAPAARPQRVLGRRLAHSWPQAFALDSSHGHPVGSGGSLPAAQPALLHRLLVLLPWDGAVALGRPRGDRALAPAPLSLAVVRVLQSHLLAVALGSHPLGGAVGQGVWTLCASPGSPAVRGMVTLTHAQPP